MIRAFRRTRFGRALAGLGVVAMLALTAASLLHAGGDDLLCDPAFGTSNLHPTVAAAEAGPTVRPEHCVLCHAFQSARAVVAAERFGPPSVDTRLLASGPPTFVHAVFSTATPARAPPAL